MNMDTKSNLHIQSNGLVMVIAEEQHTLRTLFDDIEPDEDGHQYILSHEFQVMHWRSRYNPDLHYYRVDCEAYKRYGYTADELFDEIYERYITSGFQPLDELYTFIERI